MAKLFVGIKLRDTPIRGSRARIDEVRTVNSVLNFCILKQFTSTTVSQTTAMLSEDMEDMKAKIDDLDLKVDTISEALHENLSDHELRLARLKQQTA